MHKAWQHKFSILIFIAIAGAFIYIGQFEETEAYAGAMPLLVSMRADYWFLLLVWLAVFATLWPTKVSLPSDLFLCIYLLGSCFFSSIYWPSTRLIDFTQAFFLACLLFLPAILILICTKITVLLRKKTAEKQWHGLPKSWFAPTLVVLLLLAMVLGYQTAGSDASFGLDDVYERRISGRDKFAENIVSAYLLQMSSNVFAPLLAFLSVKDGKKFGLALAVIFAIFSFWILGLKSPMLNICLLISLGYLLKSGKYPQLARWFLQAFAGVMLLAVLEMYFYDKSILADYGIRRAGLVSSMIQAYFIDAMSYKDWYVSMLRGIDIDGFSTPAYFVGAMYFGNEMTNANTNAYIHELALWGLPGYFFITIIMTSFLILLNTLYSHYGLVEAFALSAIAGLLLIEQAFSTMMVSSGIGIGLVLCLLFYRRPTDVVLQ